MTARLGVGLVTPDAGTVVILFLLIGDMESSIAKVPPVQRAKSGAGLLLIQMYETETPASSRHNVCREADRSDSSKLRE